VLWAAATALRAAFPRGQDRASFYVILRCSDTPENKHGLHVVVDGDGVTIDFPEDF
jgi:hypothetical protein